MTTVNIIIQIFCLVDDEMKNMPKHSQAKLNPSELITIGILFALKGDHFRAFYRWLSRDYADLFAGVPERTRLARVLKTHQDWCDRLLAAPSFFTVTIAIPLNCSFPFGKGAVLNKSERKGRIRGAGAWASSSAGCSTNKGRWWRGTGRL